MPDPDNIVLIGFAGAGKDTVGRILSALTGRQFLSTDDFIEIRENSTVSQIIKTRGETAFRKMERQALSCIRRVKNTVLATGGGTVIDARNRSALKSMGTVIHLDVSAAKAADRLKNQDHRPLITDRGSVLNLHRQRHGMYDFADRRVDTDRASPAAVARRIAGTLKIKAPEDRWRQKRLIINAPSRSYPVLIGHLQGDRPRELLNALSARSRRAVIVTNALVGALFRRTAADALRDAGIDVEVMTIPDRETAKSMSTALKIVDFLADRGMSRSDLVVALGGGVVGDVTGFACSIYKRGASLIQIPTTLLAQIDAAIGGKTGVNHPGGKNMIGTFYQPRAVFCDPRMVLTLPDAVYADGLAEAVKYAVIADARMFQLLEKETGRVKDRDPEILRRIIIRCAAIKKMVIERDEREEKGLREVLNFGHTIGHVIETLTGFRRYGHGQAVAAGMAAESRIAFDSGCLDRREHYRIIELLKAFGLKTALPRVGSKNDFLAAVRRDKKKVNGRIMMPVPVRIGAVILKEVACEKLL